MPPEPLTAALIGQHYADRYAAIATQLHQWELAKADFLVQVGRECLALVRTALEPLPEHDVAGRKAMRAQVVKDIEAMLPDVEGIGAPQVNRWIRWAGIGEVLTPDATDCAADGNGVFLSWPCGLKQASLMVLERYVVQHEPTATFRIKSPWQNRIAEVRNVVRLAIECTASAAELESALDEEAEFPKSPEPKAGPCPTPTPKTSTTSAVATPPSSTTARPTAPSPTPSNSVPASSTNGSPSLAGKSPAPMPASTDSNRKSAPSPTSSAASVAPSAATSLTPRDLADQAFKLMQQPEILAGVFRREWSPDLVLMIVENLIRAMGENSKNLLGLAKAYHRMAPVVLTHFEAYVEADKFKLRKKDQPEPPTLEQLAPAAALVTA